MKKMLFLMLALTITVVATAKPVTPETARRVAENFMNYATQSNSKITLADITSELGLVEMYVFNAVDNSAFVIVAADDVAKPILGYSTSNGMGRGEMPENLAGWLGHYAEEIGWAANNIQADEKTTAEWSQLISGNIPKGTAKAVVEPLVSTTWDQGMPYNNQCPYDKYGSSTVRSYTGCVATSMAQVMNYWGWPKKGNSSKTYTCTTLASNAPTNQISANFDTTYYDWNNMPSGQGTMTSAQKKAVSTLMFHCGVSVEMGYSIQGSGADPSKIAPGMKTYFGYSNGMKSAYKQMYSDANWNNMIKEDLDSGKPIVYGGSAQDGTDGHSFVCDGYDASGNYHFNWGWSGDSDGYFPLSSLNPGTGGVGSTGYNFTYYQHAVFAIVPGMQTYQTFTLNNTTIPMDSYITGTCTIRNYSMAPFKGYIGVGVFDAAGELKTVMNKSANLTISANASKSVSINHKATWPLAAGTYTARAVCSIDGENWVEIKDGYLTCPTFVEFTTTGVSGIDDVETSNYEVVASVRKIEVNGAMGMPIYVTDIAGRTIYSSKSANENVEVNVPKRGIYLVKIGNEAARKVLVR